MTESNDRQGKRPESRRPPQNLTTRRVENPQTALATESNLDLEKIHSAAMHSCAFTAYQASAITDAIAEYHRQITPAPDTSRSETASPPPGGTGGVGDLDLNPKQAAALESFGNESPLCLIPDLHAPKCNCGERTKTPSVSGPETIGS